MPNKDGLVYRVVRDSGKPLLFAEIMRRMNSILPITTRNPKTTIRNAISQSQLVVNTGDGRYGWKDRVINRSVFRLTISETDLSQPQITFP